MVWSTEQHTQEAHCTALHCNEAALVTPCGSRQGPTRLSHRHARQTHLIESHPRVDQVTKLAEQHFSIVQKVPRNEWRHEPAILVLRHTAAAQLWLVHSVHVQGSVCVWGGGVSYKRTHAMNASSVQEIYKIGGSMATTALTAADGLCCAAISASKRTCTHLHPLGVLYVPVAPEEGPSGILSLRA